jgi:hypothetical protein
MRATSAPARLRRALDRAERRFVARVVADRGIGSWRVDTDQRLARALDVFSRRGRLSRQAAADLVVALVDKPLRDRCWRLVESQVDVDWKTFWMHLSRRALSPYRAEPLFLLAWSAWRLGDVQLARSAADAALAQDPGHQAAAMLLGLLSLYVEPGGPPSLGSRAGTSAAAS